LLAPLTAHPEWRDLMNKDLARKVLADDVDPREAADFMLARFIRKVA
jgi:hypothetical protein